MKNNKRSVFAIALAAFMLMALLAGCGGNGGNNGSNAGAGTNAAGNNAPAGEDKAGETASTDETKLSDGNITILYHTSKEQYEENKKGNPNAYDAVWETIPQFEAAYGGKVTVIAVPWACPRKTAER